jgi:hypothetical protein
LHPEPACRTFFAGGVPTTPFVVLRNIAARSFSSSPKCNPNPLSSPDSMKPLAECS